jgi:hypothetical protein
METRTTRRPRRRRTWCPDCGGRCDLIEIAGAEPGSHKVFMRVCVRTGCLPRLLRLLPEDLDRLGLDPGPAGRAR